jgi:hypothetical protein
VCWQSPSIISWITCNIAVSKEVIQYGSSNRDFHIAIAQVRKDQHAMHYNAQPILLAVMEGFYFFTLFIRLAPFVFDIFGLKHHRFSAVAICRMKSPS